MTVMLCRSIVGPTDVNPPKKHNGKFYCCMDPTNDQRACIDSSGTIIATPHPAAIIKPSFKRNII